MDIPVLFAFSAGVVAAFNPCGAAMFPAYVGYHIGGIQEHERGSKLYLVKILLRGFRLGFLVTVGFLSVFGSIGILLSVGAGFLAPILPFVGLAVGVSITFLGLWLLITGKNIAFISMSTVKVGGFNGGMSTVLFGCGYALASLSCALPIFLAAVGIVVGAGLSSGRTLQIVFGTISYSLGMGIVMTGITLTALLFEEAISRLITQLLGWINIVGKLTMVVAGLYINFYWLIGEGSEVLWMRMETLLQ
jgi:cytochrome c biogenesis protein CcdA